MKLIALKDFRNVQALGIRKHDDANRNNQIDKGETLEIGTGKTFKDLNNHEKNLVASLTVAGCVGDAADKKVVEAVEAEVALDRKREAAAAKAAEASNNTALVAQLLETLKAKPGAAK